MTLSAERLTDMLNGASSFELIDVAVEALVDGRIIERRSMIVSRDELLVVHASGPRGARERRQRTRPHPITVKIGPYIVRGDLHALPTTDPFVALRRRPQMVPLTDGTIGYSVAGAPVSRGVATLIVNRSAMDWAVPAPRQVEVERFPELAPVSGLLVKDFTGEIHGVARERSRDDDVADIDDVVASTPAAADDPTAVDASESTGSDDAAPASDEAAAVAIAAARRARRPLRRAG